MKQFASAQARKAWTRYRAMPAEQRHVFVARFFGSLERRALENAITLVCETLEWVALNHKSLSAMTIEEVYALDSLNEHAIGHKGPAPVAPAKRGWKIADFFISAAERKGATGLSTLVAESDEFEIVQDGSHYKCQWSFAEGGSFTIYSDGAWSYELGKTFLNGKLRCPHAKGWIADMIRKGTPAEFARADWGDYYAMRHNVK